MEAQAKKILDKTAKISAEEQKAAKEVEAARLEVFNKTEKELAVKADRLNASEKELKKREKQLKKSNALAEMKDALVQLHKQFNELREQNFEAFANARKETGSKDEEMKK